MARSSFRTAGLAVFLAAPSLGCEAFLGLTPDGGLPDGGAEPDAGAPQCVVDADCADTTGWCDRGLCQVRDTGSGEGEGEQYLQPFVLQDDGAGLVETALEESFGLALAVAQVRGAPVVFAAESAGEGLSGAVLVHRDPFGAMPQTERLEGVFGASHQRSVGHVADLDGDGDLDLLVLGNSRFGVALDDGTEFGVLDTHAATLRDTSAGVVDLDQDGTVEMVLPGLNSEYWSAKVVDGALQVEQHDHRWQVEHDYYCAASFVGGVIDQSPILLMVGRWCGRDTTGGTQTDGPARLFLLDASMAEVHSLDLNADDEPVPMLAGSTAYVSAARYTVDPNNDGEWQATMAIGVSPAGFTSFGFVDESTRIAGVADLDGDGTDSWLGYSTSPPSGFVQLPGGRFLSGVGDADGDGRDELFLSWWPWRMP